MIHAHATVLEPGASALARNNPNSRMLLGSSRSTVGSAPPYIHIFLHRAFLHGECFVPDFTSFTPKSSPGPSWRIARERDPLIPCAVNGLPWLQRISGGLMGSLQPAYLQPGSIRAQGEQWRAPTPKMMLQDAPANVTKCQC